MASYTVKSGDSFASIAGKEYGDQRMFNVIMGANSGISMLQPGMVIRIPNVQSRPSGQRHYVGPDDVARANIYNARSGYEGQIPFAEGTAPNPYYQYILDSTGSPSTGASSGTGTTVSAAGSAAGFEPGSETPAGSTVVDGNTYAYEYRPQYRTGTGYVGSTQASRMQQSYAPQQRSFSNAVSSAEASRMQASYGINRMAGYGLSARIRRATAEGPTTRPQITNYWASNAAGQEDRANALGIRTGTGNYETVQSYQNILPGGVIEQRAQQARQQAREEARPESYQTSTVNSTEASRLAAQPIIRTVEAPEGRPDPNQRMSGRGVDQRGELMETEAQITQGKPDGTHMVRPVVGYKRDAYGTLVPVYGTDLIAVPVRGAKDPGAYLVHFRDRTRLIGGGDGYPDLDVTPTVPPIPTRRGGVAYRGTGNYAPYEWRPGYGGTSYGGGGYTQRRAVQPNGIAVRPGGRAYGPRTGGAIQPRRAPAYRQPNRAFNAFMNLVSWRLF